MIEWIITTENPDAYYPTEEEPMLYESVIRVAEVDGVWQLNIMHSEAPALHPGDTMIAATQPDGIPLPGYDYDAYMGIVPHGNNPDGTATGLEQFQHTWAGWHPNHRMFGEPASLAAVARIYPTAVRPYHAQIRHKYFDTPATPASTGWGFRVELAGTDYSRPPAARAIGVYSDPECTAYLWTTGAFQLGTSDWQTDGDDEPLEVWYTNSWDGDRPDDKKDWHIAFLLGSAQEGHQTLPAGSSGEEYLFWEHNHGQGGGTFVDSGVTVTSIIGGGVLGVTDSSGFNPGEPLQIDGQNTEYVREHSAGIIVVDPHIASAVGNNIFWQRAALARGRRR